MKKNFRIAALFLAIAVLFASCASSTVIQSNPAGARLYLNGESVGTTPYVYRDTKIIFSNTDVKLMKDGYEPFYGSFSRDEAVAVGPLIGGLFFWIPFLWVMKYKPARLYEMQPTEKKSAPNRPGNPLSQTKAEKLRELKKLLDDKILTQEEYEAEKLKILAED